MFVCSLFCIIAWLDLVRCSLVRLSSLGSLQTVFHSSIHSFGWSTTTMAQLIVTKKKYIYKAYFHFPSNNIGGVECKLTYTEEHSAGIMKNDLICHFHQLQQVRFSLVATHFSLSSSHSLLRIFHLFLAYICIFRFNGEKRAKKNTSKQMKMKYIVKIW